MATLEVESIFSDVIDRAKAIDPGNARVWFDSLMPLHLEGGALIIGCPDETKQQYLSEHCKHIFTQAAQQITGHLITVDFSVNEDIIRSTRERGLVSRLKLHPDYTFDNFVVGPSTPIDL